MPGDFMNSFFEDLALSRQLAEEKHTHGGIDGGDKAKDKECGIEFVVDS